MLDLALLVADKNAQFALRGAFHRPQALGIRPIEFECIVHPQRDGGARKTGADILRLKRNAAQHALLVFDWEGCGADRTAAELEAQLDQRLAVDWENRAKAIVITPEVDTWVWGSDNALEAQLKWTSPQRLRAWLIERGFEFFPNGKPVRPKEALEATLRHIQLPRSSAFYEHIAGKISLRNCQDAAFQRLRENMVEWFPMTDAAL
jgi:hypothetical protein